MRIAWSCARRYFLASVTLVPSHLFFLRKEIAPPYTLRAPELPVLVDPENVGASHGPARGKHTFGNTTSLTLPGGVQAD
jgi:hypothetical protein